MLISALSVCALCFGWFVCGVFFFVYLEGAYFLIFLLCLMFSVNMWVSRVGFVVSLLSVSVPQSGHGPVSFRFSLPINGNTIDWKRPG